MCQWGKLHVARLGHCKVFDLGHIYFYVNMEAALGPMGEFFFCPDT